MHRSSRILLPACFLALSLACDNADTAAKHASASAPPAAQKERKQVPEGSEQPAPAPTAKHVVATPGAQPTRPPSAELAQAATAVPGPGSTVTPPVTPPSAFAHTEDERNTIDVFEAAAPGTVFVTQSQVVYDRFSMRAAEVPAGAGTGFIWDDQGHIVTNCHVVLNNCELSGQQPKLKVTLFDQKSYEAKLIGVDPYKDIAVLEIDAPPEALTPLRRPTKDYKLRVGQKTLAIGNPFGLDHSLTTGVISALGREVKGVGKVTIRDMIQTDAAINPGNSGGPLLDSAGQLIGMNTMIFSASGSSAGIGFAVPGDTIARRVPQLIRSGRPERVGLGISVFPDATTLRLGADGIVVKDAPRGSAAAKAGLRGPIETRKSLSYEIIVGIGAKRIHNFDDLYAALEDGKVGDKVMVTVRSMPANTVRKVEIELQRLR